MLGLRGAALLGAGRWAVLRTGDSGLLRPHDNHPWRLNNDTLRRLYDHTLMRWRCRTLLRLRGDPMLRRRHRALLRLGNRPLGRSAWTAQLLDTPAITLLDAGVVGAASAPLDHPGILRLIEPASRRALLPVIFSGIDRVQLLIEAAEPWIAADHLLVRAPGIAAIETLAMRRCPDAVEPGADNQQGGQ
jgi:hypothetical protein